MNPGPRVGPDAATGAPTARRCPTVASAPMNAATCPTNRDGRKQPDVEVLFFVATLEIGMPECARPVTLARTVEAAGRRGERPDVANDPMPTDPMSSFFVRITLQMSRAPR